MARARGFDVRVALASTLTAARLAVAGFSGVTVISPGQERSTLAGLPLRVLETSSRSRWSGRSNRLLDLLIRWGLRTVGDLAALPAADLFERLGEPGVRLQRLARGEDERPLVPERDEEPFEASIALEWPLEVLEPLSFVITRLLDPLADRLERAGAGAVRIEVRLRLTTREIDRRQLELPTPIRDPRVMRTLILLDLEARRPAAGIDGGDDPPRAGALARGTGIAARATAASAGADSHVRGTSPRRSWVRGRCGAAIPSGLARPGRISDGDV